MDHEQKTPDFESDSVVGSRESATSQPAWQLSLVNCPVGVISPRRIVEQKLDLPPSAFTANTDPLL